MSRDIPVSNVARHNTTADVVSRPHFTIRDGQGSQGRPQAARRGSLDGPVSDTPTLEPRSPTGLRGRDAGHPPPTATSQEPPSVSLRMGQADRFVDDLFLFL